MKYEVIMYRKVLQNTVLDVDIDSTDINEIVHEAYQQIFKLKESQWMMRDTEVQDHMTVIGQIRREGENNGKKCL